MSEPATVMPPKKPVVRSRPVAVPEPEELVLHQARIPESIKRMYRIAAAYHNANAEEVMIALSTQINPDGSFKFPWKRSRR